MIVAYQLIMYPPTHQIFCLIRANAYIVGVVLNPSNRYIRGTERKE
jgi:hypothetical protein